MITPRTYKDYLDQEISQALDLVNRAEKAENPHQRQGFLSHADQLLKQIAREILPLHLGNDSDVMKKYYSVQRKYEEVSLKKEGYSHNLLDKILDFFTDVFYSKLGNKDQKILFDKAQAILKHSDERLEGIQMAYEELSKEPQPNASVIRGFRLQLTELRDELTGFDDLKSDSLKRRLVGRLSVVKGLDDKFAELLKKSPPRQPRSLEAVLPLPQPIDPFKSLRNRAKHLSDYSQEQLVKFDQEIIKLKNVPDDIYKALGDAVSKQLSTAFQKNDGKQVKAGLAFAANFSDTFLSQYVTNLPMPTVFIEEIKNISVDFPPYLTKEHLAKEVAWRAYRGAEQELERGNGFWKNDETFKALANNLSNGRTALEIEIKERRPDYLKALMSLDEKGKTRLYSNKHKVSVVKERIQTDIVRILVRNNPEEMPAFREDLRMLIDQLKDVKALPSEAPHPQMIRMLEALLAELPNSRI